MAGICLKTYEKYHRKDGGDENKISTDLCVGFDLRDDYFIDQRAREGSEGG